MASTPEPHESLADYLRRLRTASQMSQKELANRANIHLQSLGKIERGQTTRLNHKTLRGLAYALSIPDQYSLPRTNARRLMVLLSGAALVGRE